MRRLSKRHASLIFSLGLILAATLIGLNDRQFKQLSQFFESTEPGWYEVLSISDGDTIRVDMAGREETIRFIGVDTPETHHPNKAVQCYGQAAAEQTRKLIGSGNVRLEADPLSNNRDRYQRLLRYVYNEQGILLNKQLIADGYAFAYTSFPFGKLEEFRAAQKSAEAGNRGLWQRCTVESNGNQQSTNPSE